MFEKKDKQNINYDLIIGPDFLRFIERIEELEQETKKIERDIGMENLEWDANISHARREVVNEKKELIELKVATEELKRTFINLVTELKMNSNMEDFVKLKRRIEDWQLHKFITRREFDMMLKERDTKKKTSVALPESLDKEKRKLF